MHRTSTEKRPEQLLCVFCTSDETLILVCFEIITLSHPLQAEATWNDYSWHKAVDNIKKIRLQLLHLPQPVLDMVQRKISLSCLNVRSFFGLFFLL